MPVPRAILSTIEIFPPLKYFLVDGVLTRFSMRSPTNSVVSAGTSEANCGSIKTLVSAGFGEQPASNSAAIKRLFRSRNFFHRFHHSQKIAAVDLADVVGGVASFEQRA